MTPASSSTRDPAPTLGHTTSLAGCALDPAAHTLKSGDLHAVFFPSLGMLGASLRHKGEEILRRIDDLPAAAAKGSTAGIPILHPFANRLAGMRYRAAGRDVTLDRSSPLLHFDSNGLPTHGVPWALLAWKTLHTSPTSLEAALDWDRPDLLAMFPYPHRLAMTARLDAAGLTIQTTLTAAKDGPVPISFGFHPYFGLPGLPRKAWHAEFPSMRRLVSDSRQIPTGAEEPFAALNEPLEDHQFDDGFALDGPARFVISGAARRIAVDFIDGYPYAQIYAPRTSEFIAIEPMTAPTDALISARGLRLAHPGRPFTSTFRVQVESAP